MTAHINSRIDYQNESVPCSVKVTSSTTSICSHTIPKPNPSSIVLNQYGCLRESQKTKSSHSETINPTNYSPTLNIFNNNVVLANQYLSNTSNNSIILNQYTKNEQRPTQLTTLKISKKNTNISTQQSKQTISKQEIEKRKTAPSHIAILPCKKDKFKKQIVIAIKHSNGNYLINQILPRIKKLEIDLLRQNQSLNDLYETEELVMELIHHCNTVRMQCCKHVKLKQDDLSDIVVKESIKSQYLKSPNKASINDIFNRLQCLYTKIQKNINQITQQKIIAQQKISDAITKAEKNISDTSNSLATIKSVKNFIYGQYQYMSQQLIDFSSQSENLQKSNFLKRFYLKYFKKNKIQVVKNHVQNLKQLVKYHESSLKKLNILQHKAIKLIEDQKKDIMVLDKCYVNLDNILNPKTTFKQLKLHTAQYQRESPRLITAYQKLAIRQLKTDFIIFEQNPLLNPPKTKASVWDKPSDQIEDLERLKNKIDYLETLAQSKNTLFGKQQDPKYLELKHHCATVEMNSLIIKNFNKYYEATTTLENKFNKDVSFATLNKKKLTGLINDFNQSIQDDKETIQDLKQLERKLVATISFKTEAEELHRKIQKTKLTNNDFRGLQNKYNNTVAELVKLINQSSGQLSININHSSSAIAEDKIKVAAIKQIITALSKHIKKSQQHISFINQKIADQTLFSEDEKVRQEQYLDQITKSHCSKPITILKISDIQFNTNFSEHFFSNINQIKQMHVGFEEMNQMQRNIEALKFCQNNANFLTKLQQDAELIMQDINPDSRKTRKQLKKFNIRLEQFNSTEEFENRHKILLQQIQQSETIKKQLEYLQSEQAQKRYNTLNLHLEKYKTILLKLVKQLSKDEKILISAKNKVIACESNLKYLETKIQNLIDIKQAIDEYLTDEIDSFKELLLTCQPWFDPNHLNQEIVYINQKITALGAKLQFFSGQLEIADKEHENISGIYNNTASKIKKLTKEIATLQKNLQQLSPEFIQLTKENQNKLATKIKISFMSLQRDINLKSKDLQYYCNDLQDTYQLQPNHFISIDKL